MKICDLVNEHPSFQRAQIGSTEIYKGGEVGVPYNFLIVDLKIGTTKFYLCIDGRNILDNHESVPSGILGNVVRLVAETSVVHLY